MMYTRSQNYTNLVVGKHGLQTFEVVVVMSWLLLLSLMFLSPQVHLKCTFLNILEQVVCTNILNVNSTKLVGQLGFSYHYSVACLCSILYVEHHMGLHYITSMGRNLRNKKKLTPVRISNSANMSSKHSVNNVGTFTDSTTMNNIFSE